MDKEMLKELDLTGKVALVTGAGQSIGKATALRLARYGADVAVNDINQKAAEQTVEEIKKIGRRSIAVIADVASMVEVDKMITKIEKELGTVDILVNNAGISADKPILNCTEEDWDRHVDIMAKGTFSCMKRVAPAMIEKKWGRIINLGSYVAQLNCSTKNFGPYCAAKGAIIGLTQVAAQEWAPYVLVNAVGPGDVETKMMELEWKQLGERSNRKASEVKEEYRQRLILEKFEQPDDIAKAIVFLCTELADQITGSHFIVSGGLPFARK
jgi:NAD(P)-dependent dehydrogenase (short-subunit alcohol dehydrogenase family)